MSTKSPGTDLLDRLEKLPAEVWKREAGCAAGFVYGSLTLRSPGAVGDGRLLVGVGGAKVLEHPRLTRLAGKIADHFEAVETAAKTAAQELRIVEAMKALDELEAE